MSQRNTGAPRGQSSYTPPTRRPAEARSKRGLNGSAITIGVLAVLVLAIGLLGFWLTNNPTTPVSPTPVPVVNVWDYGSSTANAVSVSNITSTTTIQFSGDRWRVTAPVQEDADEVSVETAVGSLKTLESTRMVVENPTDLAQYGLASPALTVTIVLSGTTPPDHTLLIGSTNVGGSDYYVKTTISPTVYLVSNATIEPLKAWIDTPPKAEPTATPLATEIITSTATISLTATPAAGTTPAAPTPTGGGTTPTAVPTEAVTPTP